MTELFENRVYPANTIVVWLTIASYWLRLGLTTESSRTHTFPLSGLVRELNALVTLADKSRRSLSLMR